MSQPLWRVMHEAFHSARDNGIATPGAHAAELRAVIDWLEAVWSKQGKPPLIESSFHEGMRIAEEIHRSGTLNMLRAEADRAEAGE